MRDADEEFEICYAQGRKAARIGKSVTANPYLDSTSLREGAWAEGHVSVDVSLLSLNIRAHIHQQGADTAANGSLASSCPYLDHPNPEYSELWLIGYAPAIEAD